MYIYLHHFNILIRRRSRRRRTIASFATQYNISTTRAFVHALRQISRLRPRQLITGRQRRRYPNSTPKTDFPLHDRPTYRESESPCRRKTPTPCAVRVDAYLERLVEANDVRMTQRRHDARLAVQVRPHVLVLDLSSVDDLYRHLTDAHAPATTSTPNSTWDYQLASWFASLSATC